MEPRMKNPALVLDLNPSIQAMLGPVFGSGVPAPILDLVALRVSQMNTCELCIGETLSKGAQDPALNVKLENVLHFRDADCFTPAERVALTLAEAVTRLDRRYESVSDPLWAELTSLFDEKQRAALIVAIAAMNMFTRMNVATRQTTPDWRT